MMNAPLPAIMIPEGAPFSADQRAWLSGFFAALLNPQGAGATALSGSEAAQLTGGAAGPALADNDDAPWHDPGMPIDQRMQLATEKPLAPRLMAALAQQDCGQCGYNCADYANALFLKKEERLNLCVPGGKDTARMLKALAPELDAVLASKPAENPAEPPVVPDVAAPAISAATPSRDNPAQATFLSRRRLNAAGSEKETWHLEFDLSEGALDYVVGDSFGVFPRNDTGLVDQTIAMLGAAHSTEVRGRTLREVLHDEVSLGLAPDSLFELYSYVSGGAARAKARALARGEDPDGDAAHLDVMAVLQKFQSVRPHPEAFVDALEPLQPRLYSISSSPKTQPGRLTLTVDTVRYLINKRKRLGVASTYFAERTEPGERFRAYIQKAHNFALPADPATPIIMVGPGTGIAPFRAFLQDRLADKAPGRNWLFYGHQRQAHDFFYRDELEAMKAAGHLTRLSLAWSRDGGQKYYVQDRMREVGAELWRWLAEGAHFYICGDAKRMAKDVEAALVDIVQTHGVRSTDEAVAFIGGLKKSGRYQADVY
jgi:sulfite reductase (NADPH) flavoprotein alpha-component